MIPRDYVTEWRERAPWNEDFQVEQDLVISRALVAIFSDAVLAGALAPLADQGDARTETEHDEGAGVERERDGAHAVAARLAVDRARPRTTALPSSAPWPVVVRK